MTMTGTKMPAVVRMARAFLVLCIVIWGLGAVQAGNHLRRAGEAGETSSEIRSDARVFVGRTALAIFAAVSVWAIARRHPVGRWSTVALACVCAYRLLPGFAYTGRALSGRYAAPVGLIAYSSTEEAIVAVIVGTAILAALVALAVRMSVAKDAATYFAASKPR